MHRFLIPLFFFVFASAQDITVSKDSIKICNNLASSFADIAILTSHSSAPIHFDSGFIMIAEMDTVGLSYAISHNGLEVGWRTGTPAGQTFSWTMDSAGPNAWRLVKKTFTPTNAEPLFFSGNGTTAQIFALEIGIYLFGDAMPKYTRYLRGTMRLFFSNGQAVELKLWSQDLRTAVWNRGFETQFSALSTQLSAFSYRYLANGRRIPASNRAGLQRNRISSTKVYEKK